MPSAVRGATQLEEPSALEHAVQDRLGQVAVVKHLAPRGLRLVRRHQDRAPAQVALVDHVEEHVRRLGPVREVADLVDHEHGGRDVVRERLAEAALDPRQRQRVHHLVRAREERLEPVLDRPVGDRDAEVRLPQARVPREDRRAALGDELGPEVAAQHREPDGGLEGEAEVLDRRQEREVGLPHRAFDPRLGAVGDFLGDERGEELAVGHLLGLRPHAQLGIEAPNRREVEAAQESIEVDRGRHAVSLSACSTYWDPNSFFVAAWASAASSRTAPAETSSACRASTSPRQVRGCR